MDEDAQSYAKKVQEKEDSGWFNSFDELMSALKKAHEYKASPTDVIAYQAALWAARNGERMTHLTKFLVKKGIMTDDDLVQLDRNVDAALKQKMDETVKKYPSLVNDLKQNGEEHL